MRKWGSKAEINVLFAIFKEIFRVSAKQDGQLVYLNKIIEEREKLLKNLNNEVKLQEKVLEKSKEKIKKSKEKLIILKGEIATMKQFSDTHIITQ